MKTFKTIFFLLLIMAVMTNDYAQAKTKVKKASKLELEKCEDKLNYGTCEKVEVFCKDGDSRSCVSLAIYWQKQGDSDQMLSYVKLACENGDQTACDSYGKLYTGHVESQAMSDKMKELEAQKRAIAEQNAEIENQQKKQRMIQGLQQMSGFMNQLNQPTNPQPKQQKCRTVVRPSNGMDGATAYYDTVCD